MTLWSFNQGQSGILKINVSVQELFIDARYHEVIETAQRSGSPREMLLGALAALRLNDYAQVNHFLRFPFEEPDHEAGRLALCGALRWHFGDLAGYRALTQRAAQLAQTWLTLHYLGGSLPPRDSLIVRLEALALATAPLERSLVAIGVTRTLWRLGRVAEALPYAALVTLHTPDPSAYIDWVRMLFSADATASLPELRKRLRSITPERYSGAHLETQVLMAELYLADGQPHRAQRIFDQAFTSMLPNQLPFHAFLGIRIYRALGREDQAMRLAVATQLGAGFSVLHQAMSQLSMGLAHFPNQPAIPLLEQALPILEEESPIEALKAAGLLAYLRQETLSPHYQDLLNQWTPLATQWLPSSVNRPFEASYRLLALGRPRLLGPNGPIHLRPRGYELLVLLLSHPEGWERAELAQALYGDPDTNSLKAELRRLVTALPGVLAPKPWRLAVPLEADFLEVRSQLLAGNLMQAIEHFHASLLPRSHSPGIENLRFGLESELKEAVLNSNQTDLLFRLAEQLRDDLEVWEALLEQAEDHHPQFPAVVARVKRLRQLLSQA
jgi:hypothetical protein